MPTAVASAIAPQISQPHSQHEVSPKSTYPTLAPSAHPSVLTPERKSPASATPSAPIVVSEGPAHHRLSPDGRRTSPKTVKSGLPPKIVVKKEPPSSPEVPATARHRPRKLDLTSSTPVTSSAGVGSRPSAPLTARDSASLGMMDVGLACLSPGFQTQDPNMREQLQRSYSVRDQQRHIIESRLQKNAKPGDGPGERQDHQTSSGLKTPMTSKKRPPPGLSIVPPSHEQFANERVIQSAPLHGNFTGRHHPHPLTRHIANGPSNLSDSSHIHHVPAMQTSNRLPPITDVFANEGLGINRDGQGPTSGRPGPYHGNPTSSSSHSNQRPAFPSPSLQGPPSSHPTSHGPTRPREYRSAEEAVAEMTSGREDLLPKLVHYGGHQPPTPPSPPMQQHGLTPNKQSHSHLAENSRSGGGGGGSRRRPRAEYERDMGTPPLGSGPSPRRGPFGEGRDSPETNRRKKEEFLGLCSRAWELFHS